MAMFKAISAIVVGVAIAVQDEDALLQSNVGVRQTQIAADSAKHFLVEAVTFVCSSLIMSICLHAFIRWATDVASQDKAPASPGTATEDTRETFNQFLSAVEAGDAEFCAETLSAHPDFANKAGAFGSTALHVAAMAGATDIMKNLLEHGADIHARDSFRDTALHGAASVGELCCMIALMDAGADLEAENAVGATPLVVAAKAEQRVACELLLDHGASPCVANRPVCLEELSEDRFQVPELPVIVKASPCLSQSTWEGDSLASGSPTLSMCSPTASKEFFHFGGEGTECN